MEHTNNRIGPKEYRKEGMHWSQVVAGIVLEKFPNLDTYTVAAGISPSGIVHFGNFRDVMTSYAVMKTLALEGKKTRFVFSWDDFDRLRKVPANVPESFVEHVGKPLANIPDPEEKEESYARNFEVQFETAIGELGLPLEFIRQSKMYGKGAYTKEIKFALDNRERIGQILFSHMTEIAKNEKNITEADFIANYFPITVYSRFSGRDNTKIISYDGGTKIKYYCHDTKQEDEIDFENDHLAKLAWKIDWPSRWIFEGVVFEPGGKDHANPGSSYDVGCDFMKNLFYKTAPLFVGYEFVGIRGGGAKMSGSKGNAVSPADLLDIYEPNLLLWLYTRAMPDAAFQLAFDSEIYRQYDEFDRECASFSAGTLEGEKSHALKLALVKETFKNPIPFRQAVAFGQILNWDANKVQEKLKESGFEYDFGSIEERLVKAKNWLLKYNLEEAIILRTSPNSEFWNTLSESQKEHIKTLVNVLDENFDSKDLETRLYDIPKNLEFDQKQNAPLQREFFKNIYMLLVDREIGPRLATFLTSIDKEQIKKLLNF
jgi:lysyl-tRNA synthetase class 1